MHELSIAQDLVDLAAEQLVLAGAPRAAAVHVRVGALAGVVPAALRSAFAAAAGGTLLAGARLVLEHVPPRVRCAPCGGAERAADSLSGRRCAACGAISAEIVAGLELELTAVELELSQSEASGAFV